MEIGRVLRQLRIDKTKAQRQIEQISQAIAALQKIAGKSGRASLPKATRRARRKVSKIARKRMAAAQRARWAKVRQQKAA